MDHIGPTLITVIGGIVGLAIVAVLVSQKAQTSQVLQGAGTALSAVINAAVGPVTNNQGNNFGSSGTGIG
jgi:purine-cytosine permease-like protein